MFQYSLQLKIIQKVFTSLPKIKTVKKDKFYIFTKFRLLGFHIVFVILAEKLSFAYDPITQKCFEMCGDGKRFILQCDDGNNEDGDGCSRDCKI
jgi:cysteine-rich repeat protein